MCGYKVVGQNTIIIIAGKVHAMFPKDKPNLLRSVTNWTILSLSGSSQDTDLSSAVILKVFFHEDGGAIIFSQRNMYETQTEKTQHDTFMESLKPCIQSFHPEV